MDVDIEECDLLVYPVERTPEEWRLLGITLRCMRKNWKVKQRLYGRKNRHFNRDVRLMLRRHQNMIYDKAL